MKVAAARNEHSTDRQLQELPPATTGSHFRRHYDKENHLDVLYPAAVTGEPLVVVGRPHFTVHVHELIHAA